jgi:predicted Rdx family selenoprotein
VGESVITVRVIRKSTRTLELLELVGERLGRKSLEPDDLGAVHIRMNGRGPRCWEEVRDALDSTGDDWRQWLHLSPRPPR